jgi:hypothetical protein
MPRRFFVVSQPSVDQGQLPQDTDIERLIRLLGIARVGLDPSDRNPRARHRQALKRSERDVQTKDFGRGSAILGHSP